MNTDFNIKKTILIGVVTNIVKIALVQTSCSANVQENMQKSLHYTKEAAAAGAHIICHQEMYRSLYFCQGQAYEHFALAEHITGPSFQLFSPVAKQFGCIIILPIFEKHMDGVYFNTNVLINTDGTLLGTYRKMHIPQDPGFDEKFYFTPGDYGFKTFDTKYGKIGTLICWDQWYPEAARITALLGAQILFYPTAIGWDSNEPKEIQHGQLDAWRTIQRAHSIANGCFVCAANRVGTEHALTFWGNSFVSNPMGKIMSNSNAQTEQYLLTEINLDEVNNTRLRWPFFRDRRVDSYEPILRKTL